MNRTWKMLIMGVMIISFGGYLVFEINAHIKQLRDDKARGKTSNGRMQVSGF